MVTRAARREMVKPCGTALSNGCEEKRKRGEPQRLTGLKIRVRQVLGELGSSLENAAMSRFTEELAKQQTRRQDTECNKPDEGGPLELALLPPDEAFWRAFVFIHFANRESANRLLYAFGEEPYWTWTRFWDTPERDTFTWLQEHRKELKGLSFGNHRQRRSPSPEALYKVFRSFRALVALHYGSPTAVFTDGVDRSLAPGEQFDILYRRLLTSLHDFGRLACWDLLVLLRNENLIKAKPDRCYLVGATGPLSGARRIWHDRFPGKLSKQEQQALDDLVAEFVKRMNVPATAVEDALCEWDKHEKQRDGAGTNRISNSCGMPPPRRCPGY
jgi:hypothetical protein